MVLSLLLSGTFIILSYAVYQFFITSKWNSFRQLAGPPSRGLFKGHLYAVLEPSISPRVHEIFVQKYGRSIRIRGVGPWDERLLTLDPVSVAHVLRNSTTYQKPWQSRRLITSLIGCGLLAAEGQVHKRQRRVATSAFSAQNMHALVPLVFRKGEELKNRWADMIDLTLINTPASDKGLEIDVCHWISRATFDIIGSAGFDYEFNAIQDETNELFCAYKDMFEVAISQGGFVRTMTNIYFPFLGQIFPDKSTRTVYRCQKVIHRVGGQIIQEKKSKIIDAKNAGFTYAGKDLLSMLLKSNLANHLTSEERLSDEDVLNNINTFMFAGSDTSSLSLTWTLLLLAENPTIQNRLRSELFSIAPPAGSLVSLTEHEIQTLHHSIANLSYLHNVVRESLRLVPPVHSSIRVATEHDELPVTYPLQKRRGGIDEVGRTITIPRGTFVHVAIEGFNLDKATWGDDAWNFNPDRWDHLPEAVFTLPGVYSNILSFSAGPRSCIGMRFSIIEIKTLLYILLTNFNFKVTGDKIFKANVVLTRPYVSGRYKEGSQCPLFVSRYIHPKQ